MAILINDPAAVKPPKFSQSKDPVFFQLKSNSAQPWAGTKCVFRITFTAPVTGLNFLLLSSRLFGPKGFVFLSTPYDSGWALPTFVSGTLATWILQVADALRTNPFIANHYTVTTTSTYIDVTANNVGDLYNIYDVSDTSSNMSAATILNGTDGYFSANFRLRFSLFCQLPGEALPTLRTETYSAPDPDAVNRHNLQAVLDDQLAFNLHPFSVGPLTDRSAKWYVNINEYMDEPPEHRQILKYEGGTDGMFVYRGGSSRLNTGNFNALATEGRPLKPYARGKQRATRGYNGKYFISYVNLAKVELSIMCVYTLSNGATGFVELADYSLPVYGAIYSTEVSPFYVAQVISLATSSVVTDSDLAEYVLVPVFDGMPSLSDYSFTPVDEEYGQQVFWFESSMGVTETVFCTGETDFGIEVAKEDFRLIFPEYGADARSREVYQRTNYFLSTGQAFSGYMEKNDLRDFFIDLVISENVWTHGDTGELYRIHINPDSFSLFRKDDALYGISFSFKRTHYNKAYSVQS